MKKTNTHILTITVSLFLAAAQISCDGAGQEFNDSFNIGGDQDNTIQEGPFGFGVFYEAMTPTWEGDQVTPAYMDMGLNPITVPGAFADMLHVYPDEYILYPYINDETRFVQYSQAVEAENDALAGDFVDGHLTPVAALNDFQDGQMVVVYFGYTYNHGDTDNNNDFASVTANFAAGTWSGIFLGEYDVAVSGSIEGKFFYSETITEFHNSNTLVSGMITVGFYGPEANEIAGVIDITRAGERFVDLFDGQKGNVNVPAP